MFCVCVWLGLIGCHLRYFFRRIIYRLLWRKTMVLSNSKLDLLRPIGKRYLNREKARIGGHFAYRNRLLSAEHSHNGDLNLNQCFSSEAFDHLKLEGVSQERTPCCYGYASSNHPHIKTSWNAYIQVIYLLNVMSNKSSNASYMWHTSFASAE